jgi:small ligand-binding sensory domain FIST
MHFASAEITNRDVDQAAEALTNQVRARFRGPDIDLLIVFLSPHFVSVAVRLLPLLRQALKPRVLLGCTGEGVISDRREIERQPAVTLIAGQLPNVQITPFVFQPRDWPSTLGDPALMYQAVGAHDEPQLIVLLADPLTTPVDEVLTTFNALYDGVPMVGGMASSAPTFGGNALLLNDRVRPGGAIGIALSGALQVDVIISQGCRPVGHPLTVTAVQKNRIVGIEGQPPTVHIHDLMQHLSQADRSLIQTNGLFIGRAVGTRSETLGRGDFVIRGVVALDRESGAISIGERVHEGATIQFHLREASTAEEDLEMMLMSQAFSDSPCGGLLFSSNGRGTRLYGHPDGDISIIGGVMGEVPLAGLFCAGEIGPIGDTNYLHGHAVSLALFRSTIPV